MRRTQFRAMAAVLAVAAAVFDPTPVEAAHIRIIDTGVSTPGTIFLVDNATNDLTALGHTVTRGGTLSDYSAYDQVWDLRVTTTLTDADVTAMGAYLRAGGRMFLTGDNSSFPSLQNRNVSLVSWVEAVGAGILNLENITTNLPQPITSAGQVVNSPNTFSSIDYIEGNTVSLSSTDGFLVTQEASTNRGSLVGWDFGDINGSPDARMLVGFDIEILRLQAWTQNMATYLDGPAPNQVVPVPPAAVLFGLGLVSLGGTRVFRRRPAAA
jgi:hypothetical protein